MTPQLLSTKARSFAIGPSFHRFFLPANSEPLSDVQTHSKFDHLIWPEWLAGRSLPQDAELVEPKDCV